MNDRIRKINALIKEEASSAILKELSLKNGVFVTVTKVDTSADLRYTRVSVRVFPQKDVQYAMRTLEHEKGMIQRSLYKRLHLRTVPIISFVYDRTGEDVDEIERLLKE